MTSERAAALAAARRAGMDPAQVASRFRFAEVSLESADARHRAETLTAADGEAEDAMFKRFLARHAPPAS
jgi:hypothetical protein